MRVAAVLLLVTAVIGRALPDETQVVDFQVWPSDNTNDVLGGWYPRNGTRIAERSGERFTTLPDGNECDILAQAGSGTQGWNANDYHDLFGEAGQVLTSAIARSSRTQVGVTASFTDHNGRRHQVDCEVTVTGHASVSVGGAYQNVQQALWAAQLLAAESWTGFIGTSRSTLRVFFGNVVAISIAVNVLN